MTERLSASGYSNVSVLGGGRILYSRSDKKVEIYGHSYGFGKADHEVSMGLVVREEEFKGYDVTCNDEGY